MEQKSTKVSYEHILKLSSNLIGLFIGKDGRRLHEKIYIPINNKYKIKYEEEIECPKITLKQNGNTIKVSWFIKNNIEHPNRTRWLKRIIIHKLDKLVEEIQQIKPKNTNNNKINMEQYNMPKMINFRIGIVDPKCIMMLIGDKGKNISEFKIHIQKIFNLKKIYIKIFNYEPHTDIQHKFIQYHF